MTQDASSGPFDQADITAKVRTILASLLEVDESDIEPATRLEALGVDSLLYLELFEELKDEFKLDFDLHQIGKYATQVSLSTVGELSDLVSNYLAKGNALFAELAASPHRPQG